jgi:hypothetical protein
LSRKPGISDLKETIQTRCEKTFWEKIEIVPATLNNDTWIMRKATLAVESEFRRESNSVQQNLKSEQKNLQ